MLSVTSKSMPTLQAINGVELFNGTFYGNFGNGLQSYDIATQSTGSVISPINYVSCVPDNDIAYPYYFDLIKSNYVTNDTVYIVSANGTVMTDFVVGKSSQAIVAQYTVSTGIESNNATNKNIRLYPNPSNATINLIYPANQANITISDITGRIVYSKNKTGFNIGASIDVSGFAIGVYTVHLVSESGAADVKFIKE